MKAERGIELDVLIICFVAVSLFGFVRLEQAIASWQRLSQLSMPGPIYLSISGALVGILGVAIALSLWLRPSWAASLTRWGVVGLSVSYWVDRLVLWRSSASQVNLLFSAVLTVICLVFVLGIMNLKSTRNYLAFRGKPHE